MVTDTVMVMNMCMVTYLAIVRVCVWLRSKK
jgi:hypothetical protein